MNNKMTFYKNNQIWILMNNASKNRKIFIEKWIYKCKKNINKKIIRYKTRWCVKNFEQLKNFYYYETFVSIIKFMNYKIIFVIIVVNNWNIEQMNIKIVFLWICEWKNLCKNIFRIYWFQTLSNNMSFS